MTDQQIIRLLCTKCDSSYTMSPTQTISLDQVQTECYCGGIYDVLRLLPTIKGE